MQIDHGYGMQIEQTGRLGDCVQSWLHTRVELDS